MYLFSGLEYRLLPQRLAQRGPGPGDQGDCHRQVQDGDTHPHGRPRAQLQAWVQKVSIRLLFPWFIRDVYKKCVSVAWCFEHH